MTSNIEWKSGARLWIFILSGFFSIGSVHTFANGVKSCVYYKSYHFDCEATAFSLVPMLFNIKPILFVVPMLFTLKKKCFFVVSYDLSP